MPRTIGLEERPGRPPLAWVLDLPGCAAEIAPGMDMFSAATERENEYINWREGFQGGVPLDTADGALPIISEPVQKAGDGFRRAFFAEDRPPVTADEVFELGWLLELSHRELSGVVQLMASELLGPGPLPEPWQTRKTELMHLVKRECHLISGTTRLTLPSEFPSSPRDALILMRGYTMNELPQLVGQAPREAPDGELFSARKLARLLIHYDLAATRNLRMEAARG